MTFTMDQIDRYIAGHCSQAETESIELALLTDKGLQQAVRTQLALKRSLVSLHEEEQSSTELDALIQNNTVHGVPRVLYVETMRSAPTTIEFKAAESVMVALDVGPNPEPNYDVQLLNKDASPILAEAGFADEEDYLNITMPSLPQGAYTLCVSSESASRNISVTVS